MYEIVKDAIGYKGRKYVLHTPHGVMYFKTKTAAETFSREWQLAVKPNGLDSSACAVRLNRFDGEGHEINMTAKEASELGIKLES